MLAGCLIVISSPLIFYRAIQLTLVGFPAESACESISANDYRVPRMVCDGTKVPRLCGQAAGASRICLSALSNHQGMEDGACKVLVPPMWLPALGDCGQLVPRYPQTASALV